MKTYKILKKTGTFGKVLKEIEKFLKN